MVGALLLPVTPAAADPEGEAIDSLNQVRRAHGLRALQRSPSLSRSSGSYARRMMRRDFFGHRSRIRVSGRFDSAGETLAWHAGWAPHPGLTVRRWLASPGHRAVLLSRSFTRIGMGIARGRLGSRVATTWVAHVGSL